MFFSGRKVFTALIRPMVPMEIRSSVLAPGESNFRAIYTTSRRLCSISSFRASSSSSRASSSASRSFVSGGGSVSLPPM